VASFDGADFAPRAGALRPPPRQLGTASDGSVMPVRPPQPFRQSMVGGSDDLAEAARPRGALDAGNGGGPGRITRPGGGGFIEYEASPDGWRITDVQLDPSLRGKGNGVALYEQMLEEAAAAGVTRVFSDNIVSQSAEPIYAALRRRGYTVTASPRSAVTRHPNNPRLFLEREDGQPIFTVSTQRARSPTPSRQGEPRPQGTITNDPMGNPPEGLDTTPSVNDPVSVRHARGRRLGFDMDNRVYGGAALDPAELDRVRFGNPESHHGRAEYFTSSTTDLERNYARADGPDLTSNIERRAEQLQWEIEQNPEAFGATADDDLMEVARRVAREQAAIGNEGVSIPAHLRLRNPVITNGVDPTVARRTVSRQPSTRWDYEIQWDDAGDEIISEGGPALDLVEATRMELDALGFSQTDEVVARLMDEVSSGDGITADAFERIMRDEPAAYVIDYEGSPGQIIADVYRRMGHDGVVLRNAERQFANMGMEPDTTHYAVFDQSNVRSPHAAFDPARSNSRDLLAGIAAPVALGGALSQRQRQ
jgi:GNAT superfamily N-acetyltransferase